MNLTREQILEMKAGREFDALVAELVMGWEWLQRPNEEAGSVVIRKALFGPEPWVRFNFNPEQWVPAQESAPRFYDWDECCGLRENDGHINTFRLPPYSTDIAAAWTVVEKLIERTPEEDIHIEHLHGEWAVDCFYSVHFGGWDECVLAETAPLAICRAALIATNSKGNANE